MPPDDARAEGPLAGAVCLLDQPDPVASPVRGRAGTSLLDARSLARLRTVEGADGDVVRIGFVFGPRALRRCVGRPVEAVRATGVGGQRVRQAIFASAESIARFCVRELNGSFRRARIATRVSVGAVGRLEDDEMPPFGPYPGTRLVDVLDNRVLAGRDALPLECWARERGVSAVFVLVDWRMFRSRVRRGDWAGFAPAPAAMNERALVFHPVAIVDVGCALSAHTLAHEFGHLLGCGHEDEPTRVAAHASAYAPPRGKTFGVMAAARPRERGRRLEWSRPHPRAIAWPFGDAGHDEARWLRTALPRLARQRFTCSGVCGGACLSPSSA